MHAPSFFLVNVPLSNYSKDSITWLFCSWNKIPDICNFKKKKKKLIWAHGFKSFGPSSARPKPETLWGKNIVEEDCSTHGSWDTKRAGRKKPEREERVGDKKTPCQVTPPVLQSSPAS